MQYSRTLIIALSSGSILLSHGKNNIASTNGNGNIAQDPPEHENRFLRKGSVGATKTKPVFHHASDRSLDEAKVHTSEYPEMVDPDLHSTHETDSLFPFGPLLLDKDHDFFEGDIIPLAEEIKDDYGKKLYKKLVKKGILPPEGKDDMDGNFDDTALGGAMTKHRWETRKDDIIQVPFDFKSSNFDSSELSNIESWMKDLEEDAKVIKFVKRTNEDHYILVQDGTGCSSYVGNIKNGGQPLTLKRNGCLYKGIVQHEFIHALGFYHEQSRPDRDKYVTINKSNIKPSYIYNFEKRNDLSSLGSEYDFGSVMHYGRTAFTKNGKDTISSKTNKAFGQRVGASETDVEQIRLMYQCKSGPRNLQSYKDNPCTSDCPCWEEKKGCKEDGACQGNLVCENNTCKTPYRKVSSGTCASNGYSAIFDKVECKQVAKKFGFKITWGPHGGYPDVVNGCSVRSDYQLFLNPKDKCNPNSHVTHWTYTSCKCTDWMPCLCKNKSGKTIGNDCKDKNKYCSNWSDQGFCKGYYQVYMTANCAKSCNVDCR